MHCFRKIVVAINFMDKGEGEVSRFSVEHFLSHGDKNFRGGTVYSVTDFRYRKTLCLRGFCHDFPSKNFSLTVPKHFVEEPFCALFQRISGSEKVFG